MNSTILLAFCAMLAWGVGDFLIQRLTRRIGDIEALAWIGIVGSILLAPFALPLLSAISMKGWVWLSVLGVLTFLSAIFDFEALKVGKISVIDMVFIIELPLTILFGVLFLHETLTLWQLVIALFIVWGVMLISIGEGKTSFTFEKGVWFAIIAAIGMALVNFFTALSAIETAPVLAVWVPWVLFTIFCFIVLMKRKKWWLFVRHMRRYPGLIIWTGIVDTIAWVFYAGALTRSGLGIITAITESYPVVALALGIVVNKERLVPRQYFGAALAVLGSILLALTII